MTRIAPGLLGFAYLLVFFAGHLAATPSLSQRLRLGHRTPRAQGLVAVVVRGDVVVMRAHGGASRRLTTDKRAVMPRLAPTVRLVAYLSTLRGQYDRYGNPTAFGVWVVPTDGSRPAWRFATTRAEFSAFAWSPDGTRLAYERGRSIAVCDAVADRCVTLTRDGHHAISASGGAIAWSPDGRQIATGVPYLGRYEPSEMDVAVAAADGRRATNITIRLPAGVLGRESGRGSYPSGDGLTWAADGRHLLFATLGNGEGPPNLTGMWQVARSGGRASLLLGTPRGVRYENNPRGSPLFQPTSFALSPHGARLATDPNNRLWLGAANGTLGRFVNLRLSQNCVLAQYTWLIDGTGLAFVTVCFVPNHNAVTSRLYSLTLAAMRPRLLPRLNTPNSADQGEIQLAESHRCVACGF